MTITSTLTITDPAVVQLLTKAIGLPEGKTINLQELDPKQMLALQEAVNRLLSQGAANPASGLVAGKNIAGDGAAEAHRRIGLIGPTEMMADFYQMAAVLQKLMQAMRSSSREQRTAQLEAEVAVKLSAVEKMKDAAEKRFESAMIQGAMQVAGGLVQMGMSILSVGFSGKGGKLEADSADTSAALKFELDGPNPPSAAEVKMLTNRATQLHTDGSRLTATGQALTGAGQGASGVMSGVGSMGAAATEREAAVLDAKRAEEDVKAKVHETAVQHANEIMQWAMDIIRDLKEKLQTIEQAATDTNRGIANKI